MFQLCVQYVIGTLHAIVTVKMTAMMMMMMMMLETVIINHVNLYNLNKSDYDNANVLVLDLDYSI